MDSGVWTGQGEAVLRTAKTPTPSKASEACCSSSKIALPTISKKP